jgi:hypothetical protein
MAPIDSSDVRGVRLAVVGYLPSPEREDSPEDSLLSPWGHWGQGAQGPRGPGCAWLSLGKLP